MRERRSAKWLQITNTLIREEAHVRCMTCFTVCCPFSCSFFGSKLLFGVEVSSTSLQAYRVVNHRSPRVTIHRTPISTEPSVKVQKINYTSNKNIHFEMILDVGIGEKRKETRFLI